MCITMAIGTGQSAGSCGMINFSPCGPPVEIPITTMSTAPRSPRRATGWIDVWRTRAATARRGARGEHLLAGTRGNADDDDRDGAARHLGTHERHAVHDRHVEVARDHVGVELRRHLER